MSEVHAERRLNGPVMALFILLVAQTALFYNYSGMEKVPTPRPLADSPREYGEWQMVNDGVIEKEILDVLRADEVISRTFAHRGTGRVANLFVAYFRSQRTGQGPHSPKNCLPGSGWIPTGSGRLKVPIEGLSEPIEVNLYTVERGDAKSVVLYWYQTPFRVIASEYEAKFYLVVDSIRYRRSDTALVRVVSPVVDGDEEGARRAAVEFVQASFLQLRSYLPS